MNLAPRLTAVTIYTEDSRKTEIDFVCDRHLHHASVRKWPAHETWMCTVSYSVYIATFSHPIFNRRVHTKHYKENIDVHEMKECSKEVRCIYYLYQS